MLLKEDPQNVKMKVLKGTAVTSEQDCRSCTQHATSLTLVLRKLTRGFCHTAVNALLS